MIHSVRMSILAIGLAIPAAAAPPQPPVPIQVELRRMTQELLDAIAPGDVPVWQRYLHDRFVHMDENGVVRDKQELVRELKPLPAGLVGRIEIDGFAATVHGHTAVAAYEMQEYLDYHGQSLRSRFRALDTWLATPGGWRLIGQHTAAVLKDPPAARVTREELCAYEGVYSLTPTIKTTIRCEGDGLTSERGDRPVEQGKPFEYRLWYSDTYVRKAEGWRYVLGQAAQPLSP